MKQLIRIIFAVLPVFISVSAQAQQGPGVTELNELNAAHEAVKQAQKDVGQKKQAAASAAEIAKAERVLAIKQAELAVVEQQVRPILSGIVNGIPAKDTPVSREKCYMARPLLGDLSFLGSAFENWSVGTSVSTQLVRYNFSTKKTSVNTSVGAGVSFRYYGSSPVGDAQEAKRLGFTDEDLTKRMQYDRTSDSYSLPVSHIKPECRATTSDVGKERKEKLAGSMFSITPTLYGSKQENTSDVSVQPAILLGFLDDILNIGTGFNLSGPETGKMFLVFSLGYGFQF